MTKRLDLIHTLSLVAVLLALILITLVVYRLSPQPEVVNALPTPSPTPLTPITYYVITYWSAAPEEVKGERNILVPLVLSGQRTDDPAANIRAGLQAIFDHPESQPEFSNFSITSITVTADHAVVEIVGVIPLDYEPFQLDYPWLFLLTIFNEPAIQTAVVTLNSECVGNLSIEGCPADQVYTRAEVEAYRIANEFGVQPTLTPAPTYERPHPCIYYNWGHPERCPED
jgi:hypothetical protein